MTELIKIVKISRIVNSVFSSNTFLLSSDEEKDCWLIDIGDIEPILKLISPEKIIKGVFLTHTHFDHMYGINKLIDIYPDCVVYTSESGKKALFSDKLNFSRYHNDSIIFSGGNIHVLHDGDKIKLFDNIYMNIIETPGHDLSCLSYYTDSEIFSGDSYIPGIKVIATFPKSNKTDAETSKQRIISLAAGRKLYPGHGDIVI